MTDLPPTGAIGCGNMGGAIARRILAAGYPLRVHDVRPEAVKPLAEAGAALDPDPAALAAASRVVLLSLPSQAEVGQVYPAVLGSLPPGGVLVNLTTGSVAALPVLAEACRARGVHLVTAPVSQGVDGAARGALSAFAAGADEGYALALPVLETFCSTVIRLPSHEAAMAAKLVTNQAWAVIVAALGEQMALLVKAGVPADDIQAVLTASCGNSWAAEHDIPSVLGDGPRGRYDETFTLQLADKDLRLAAELAAELGVPIEIGDAAAAVFRRALARFGPGAPELITVRLAEEAAGVQLGPAPPVITAGSWPGWHPPAEPVRP